MRIRSLLALCAALLMAALPALAHTAPGPRAIVNGKEVAGAVIHDSRLYVPAAEFAAAIGGTMTKDEKGAYWINTGQGIPTVAELTEMNPALAKYEVLSPYVPNMGIHMGMHGPALIAVVSNEGTLNAVEIMMPADQGWQPWFDQPENMPMELPGMGKLYSQHVYLTQPDGLLPEGAGVPVIIGGRYLSSSYSPKAHMVGDVLYIPLRTAVDLLDGSISWDQESFTATAEAKSGTISFEWLNALNPALTKYQPISEFVPNMGYHNGVAGPHITLLTDSAAQVVGFELVVPAAAGWAPWFDQPENTPMELPGLGEVYTQHLYLVDPASIK